MQGRCKVSTVRDVRFTDQKTCSDFLRRARIFRRDHVVSTGARTAGRGCSPGLWLPRPRTTHGATRRPSPHVECTSCTTALQPALCAGALSFVRRRSRITLASLLSSTLSSTIANIPEHRLRAHLWTPHAARHSAPQPPPCAVPSGDRPLAACRRHSASVPHPRTPPFPTVHRPHLPSNTPFEDCKSFCNPLQTARASATRYTSALHGRLTFFFRQVAA